MSTEVEITLGISRGRRRGGRPKAAPVSSTSQVSRIPRIARLMALAIKFQAMVDRGEVRDFADLSRLGLVTRARLTQIMNLLLLAPEIQEGLLFAEDSRLKAPTERQLRAVAAEVLWSKQQEGFGGTRFTLQRK